MHIKLSQIKHNLAKIDTTSRKFMATCGSSKWLTAVIGIKGVVTTTMLIMGEIK